MFAIGDQAWPGISKLVEEAGEVVQVCGKLMGSGGEPKHFDGSDLKTRLEEELADLQAAMMFVMRKCDLDRDKMIARSTWKLQQFENWHKGQLG